MYSTIEHTRSSFYKVYLASRKKRHQELMSKQFPKDTVPDFVWSSRIYIGALPAAVLVPALEIERRLSAPLLLGQLCSLCYIMDQSLELLS